MGKNKVIGIYLAAGEGKRMGQNKLALPLKGKPLGTYGLREAIQSHLDQVIVVINGKTNDHWLGHWANHPKVSRVICPCATEGQAVSIRFGVTKAIQENATSVIIQLADQPFVNRELIEGLIECSILANACDYEYIGYEVKNVIQPPILFNQSMFTSLLNLQGDEGARRLLQDPKVNGLRMDAPQPSSFIDVDTYEEYLTLE